MINRRRLLVRRLPQLSRRNIFSEFGSRHFVAKVSQRFRHLQLAERLKFLLPDAAED